MHPTPTHRDRRPRRRVLTGFAAGLAVLGAGVATASGSASAARAPSVIAGDRYSANVVVHAADALAALDTYVATGTDDALTQYRQRLDETATAVAAEFATPADVVIAAFEGADLPNQTAVLAALTQLGNDYQYASSDPAVGFDCSGLTSFAWRRAGVDLPSQSGSQIDASPSVDAGHAMAGDLVQYPGHVMLYLGFGVAMVHAANEATNVELSQLPDRPLNWADPNG